MQARTRLIPWARVVDLQQLQDQDLLRRFMQKQQRMSRQLFNEASVAVDTTRPTARPVAQTSP